MATFTNFSNFYITSSLGAVPVSCLDRALIKGNSVIVKYISFLDGTYITRDNWKVFAAQVQQNISDKFYPTTDHLFIEIEVDTVNGVFTFLYVSLDNSIRSNINGHRLSRRLAKLLEVVKKCIKPNTFLFFSEACRPSFDGGDIVNRVDEELWTSMIPKIEDILGLNHCIDSSNNDDACGMAFGVSMFCTNSCVKYIKKYEARRILESQPGTTGSGCVIVSLVSGEIGIGVHFPLDFKNKGEDNFNHKAMIGLCKMMDEYPENVFAFGDFNTIPGYIFDSMLAAIPEHYTLTDGGVPSFYGSFYDVVTPRQDEVWIKIIE